jgi:hypothetical protein
MRRAERFVGRFNKNPTGFLTITSENNLEK